MTNGSPVNVFACLLNCCDVCRQLQIQKVVVQSNRDVKKKKEEEEKEEQKEEEKQKKEEE